MESESDHWEPELMESQLLGHDPDDLSLEIEDARVKKKRGPKKIPPLWSGLISVRHDEESKYEDRVIQEDIDALQSLPRQPPPRRDQAWEPIFLPTAYAKDHPDISMEQYKLGERRLKNLGVEVSYLREKLRRTALYLDKGSVLDTGKEVHEVSRLAMRIRRGEYNIQDEKKFMLREDFDEPVPHHSRKVSKKRKPFTIANKIDIVYKVIIEHEKQADVAKEYRVRPGVIASLIHKSKKKPGFIAELMSNRDLKMQQRDRIQETVEDLNSNRKIIDSSAMVVNEVLQKTGEQVKEQQVRQVMKLDMDMRYRKIKTVALHSNSEKNLVLRQRWAIEFLAQARKRKVFLNIDETWLGMSDFRRMKWQVPGTTNSVPKLEIAPRITMILGMDSVGNVYVTLAQANSNSEMMELYFRALTAQLDQERPGWRRDTVIIVDGAKYHQSQAFLQVAAELRLPYMILGPHSYDAAPCELLFAHFKKADINPRHVSLGRKQVQAVSFILNIDISKKWQSSAYKEQEKFNRAI